MLLQVKQNKRALSAIIGYILLITISIVMSILVYAWLKNYVPRDIAKCPEGTSVFIKEIDYDCANSVLNITLKNNGRFSLNGYFIHVSNVSDPNILATIDISKNITEGGAGFGNSIVFNKDNPKENALSVEEPGNVKISSFDIKGYGQLYRIEIIPTRMQEANGKEKLISCGDAKVEEDLTCI